MSVANGGDGMVEEGGGLPEWENGRHGEKAERDGGVWVSMKIAG